MERPALRNAVLAALGRSPLVLILAPPGSGKSTLLAEVQAAAGADALAAFDDFVAGAAAVGDVEALLALGRRVVIGCDRRLDEVFALRRVRGEVAEFTLPDLALADGEVAGFLGPELAAAVPERALRALQARTEGWIGAWNVLKVLLAGGTPAADLAHGFSGRDRALGAYFDQVAMAPLTPEVAGFLRDVSPLETLSEDSARAASGQADVRTLIASAKRQCPFVFDVDRNGKTQRLHRLFRDHLTVAARVADPERYAAAALRAAAFAARADDWLAAAKLYAEAGAEDRSTEILHRHADDLIIGRGEAHGFRRLVGRLPEGAAQAAALSAEQALGSLITGDFAAAAALVRQANLARAGAGEDVESKLKAIEICVDFGLERFERVRKTAGAWGEAHPDADPRYRSMIAAALFWSSFVAQDSAGTQRALRLAREALGGSQSPFLEGWLTIMTAADRYEHGEAAAAARVLDEAAESGMIRDTVNLLRAAVALEQGHVAQARQLVRGSLHRGLSHSIVETSLYGWDTAARLALRDEGLPAALSLLEEAEAVVAVRHGVRAAALVRLRRATLILQTAGESPRGLEAELEALAESAAATGPCAAFVEEARLVLARSYALSGDPRRAISLVQPIQAAAQRQHRTARWGVASLIYARALVRLDEPDRAFRQAWPAITDLVAAGYLATAADERALVRPLLDRILAHVEREPDPQGHLRAVVDQLAEGALRAAGFAPDTPDAAPAAALTATEGRVLALVARGWPNARIAEHLAIGLTTVKWHLQNVFSKLAVRSRTAAVVEAQRRGLEL